MCLFNGNLWHTVLKKFRTLDNVYLFTVESYCGDCVCVLSILESVEDSCLSAAIQANHHTMIASARAETDQTL